MHDTVEAKQTDLDHARRIVERWIDDIGTDPLPRGQATDNLLDLRSALPAELPLRSEVDRLLRRMPGINVVAASWWADAAAQLLFAIDRFIPTSDDAARQAP